MYSLLAIVVWIVGGCITIYIAINHLIIGIGSILITLVLGSLCWAVEEIIYRLEEIRHNQLVSTKDYEKIRGSENVLAEQKKGTWYYDQCKMQNKETRITCKNCGTYRK